MFWRKQRAAIDSFHPLHQQLIWQRAFSVTMRPAEWEAFIQSLARHRAAVRRRKWAPPPRTATVLVPLIRVLCEDTPPNGGLGVTVDLRGPTAPGKQSPPQRFPGRRPIRSITEWWSFDPWLLVRADLRDGSVLELSVADRIRYRKIHKVNPRGKHKTKTKTKTVHRVGASRRLRKGAAVRRPATPPPPWIAVRVREQGRMVIRANAKLTATNNEAALAEHILHVVTEPFRWTPPRAAVAPGGNR